VCVCVCVCVCWLLVPREQAPVEFAQESVYCLWVLFECVLFTRECVLFMGHFEFAQERERCVGTC